MKITYLTDVQLYAWLWRYLHLDMVTGQFRWSINAGARRAGKVAGHRTPQGYITIRVGGRLHLAHRLAWLYVYGSVPDGILDHIDGDPDNNAPTNLRLAPGAINNENRRRANRNSKTGILGVSLSREGRYRASIMVDRRTMHLGSFATADEAQRAYLEAKRLLHAGCVI